MNPRKVDVRSLSPGERLDLLEEIWASLTETPEKLPLTDAQRAELDRRLDEFERDPARGIPWEEVLKKIRRRTG